MTYFVFLGFMGLQVAHGQGLKVSYVKGTVTTAEGKTVSLNMTFKKGDRVDVGPESQLVLENSEGDKLKTTTPSQWLIESDHEVQLGSGALFAKIEHAKKLAKGEYKFIIRTKTAVMGVRGTQFFTSVDASQSKAALTWMCVKEGSVEVKTADKTLLVPQGLGVSIVDTKVSDPKAFEWTKGLNWEMDPGQGSIQNQAKIPSSYGSILKNQYD